MGRPERAANVLLPFCYPTGENGRARTKPTEKACWLCWGHRATAPVETVKLDELPSRTGDPFYADCFPF